MNAQACPAQVARLIRLCAFLVADGKKADAYALWPVLESELEELTDPVQHLALYRAASLVFTDPLLVRET